MDECPVTNQNHPALIEQARGSVQALCAEKEIEMWGDGKQTRSFTFIDDCVEGILRITKSDFKEPLNLGSTEMVSMNEMMAMVCGFSGKELPIKHIPGPEGVRGRNSENSLILEKLGWEPSVTLKDGLRVRAPSLPLVIVISWYLWLSFSPAIHVLHALDVLLLDVSYNTQNNWGSRRGRKDRLAPQLFCDILQRTLYPLLPCCEFEWQHWSNARACLIVLHCADHARLDQDAAGQGGRRRGVQVLHLHHLLHHGAHGAWGAAQGRRRRVEHLTMAPMALGSGQLRNQ